MPNRNVSLYRKVLTPEQTVRYCRVIMRGKDPHPKKVEFRGLIFEADEGDYFLAYRNPRQKWERVGGDPKAAKFAADKKRAELASIATGREDAPQELGQRGIRISLKDASDLYLNEIRCTRAKDTVDLFTQTLTEFTNWMAKEYSEAHDAQLVAESSLASTSNLIAAHVVSADDEAREKQEIGIQLDEFVAQLSPKFAPNRLTDDDEQNERVCNAAKKSVMQFYGTSGISDYFQGKYLRILQHERSKPGSGTFVADLKQLRESGAILLSTATAYRRMTRYDEIRDGLTDLLPIRLSQREKDAWGIQELLVADFEDAFERQGSDEFTAKYKQMINEVNEREKKKKEEKGPGTTLNVQLFGLSDDEKKTLRNALRVLMAVKGNEGASKILLKAVCYLASKQASVAVQNA